MLKLTRDALLTSQHGDESRARTHIITPDGWRIVVTVLECVGSKARLGFAADLAVKIYREEVMDPPPGRG